MVRHALLPVALTVLLVLAGCSAAISGTDTATPGDIAPQVVSRTSSGGQCVDDPMSGFVIESRDSDGVRTVDVAANVTVPGAHYVIEEVEISEPHDDLYRLDVNTTESTEKPERTCDNGGIVHYEVTLRLPATDDFELVIHHDGQPVTGIGSGGET